MCRPVQLQTGGSLVQTHLHRFAAIFWSRSLQLENGCGKAEMGLNDWWQVSPEEWPAVARGRVILKASNTLAIAHAGIVNRSSHSIDGLGCSVYS